MNQFTIYGTWEDPFSKNQGDSFKANEFDLQPFSHSEKTCFFAGPYGFFVLDPSINLLAAIAEHTKKTSEASCGKCTPCRVGLSLAVSKLTSLLNKGGSEVDLKKLSRLSKHVSQTSLCTLGKTALIPLYNAIEEYPDVLLKNMGFAQSDHNRYNIHSITTAPCIIACPAHVDIPRYIGNILDGQYEKALGTLLEKYPFAGSCGRVCTKICESACLRKRIDQPVGILNIKRFVADTQSHIITPWLKKNSSNAKHKEQIAIIGAGPSGLTCAYHLKLKGYYVTLFEKEANPGGMANIGIPAYRLPKKILYAESAIVQKLGVKINYNQALGKDFTLDQLKENGVSAIYIAIGASQGTSAHILNEENAKAGYQIGLSFLHNVYRSLNEKISMELKGKVVVLGGGNVAMDCIRSAIRLGADEVHLVYRRTRSEMPAEIEEIIGAEEEGVIFHFLTNPIALILDDDQAVTAINMIKMKLGEPDDSGRRRPIAVEGSEYLLKADHFIPAIGQRVDSTPLINGLDGKEIELTKWGTIEVDQANYTSTSHGPFLFAGGDCRSGPATLIEAIRDGIYVADRIDLMLQKKTIEISPQERIYEMIAALKDLVPEPYPDGLCPKNRAYPIMLPPNIRKNLFDEVCSGLTKNEAIEESAKCLKCYRVYTALTSTVEETIS